LEEIFEIGKEIETFKTASELEEKVNYFIKNEKEREQIAKAGHARFVKDYRWSSISKKMLALFKELM